MLISLVFLVSNDVNAIMTSVTAKTRGPRRLLGLGFE